MFLILWYQESTGVVIVWGISYPIPFLLCGANEALLVHPNTVLLCTSLPCSWGFGMYVVCSMNLSCFQDWFIEWSSPKLYCSFLCLARLFWDCVCKANFFVTFLGILGWMFCVRWGMRYMKLLRTFTLCWQSLEKFSNGKCDLFSVLKQLSMDFKCGQYVCCIASLEQHILLYWVRR